jgi:Fe-S-cluster-containing hydrogenase component 2
MDAVSMEDDIAVINLNRCIGCGLCVPTCPSQALVLDKKDDEYVPPENAMEQMISLAKERGVIS